MRRIVTGRSLVIYRMKYWTVREKKHIMQLLFLQLMKMKQMKTNNQMLVNQRLMMDNIMKSATWRRKMRDLLRLSNEV